MMTSLRPFLALLLICVSRAAFAQQAAPVAGLKNDFFSLQPNYQLVYEDDAKPKPNRLTVLILGEVKKFGEVEARAVERRESSGGKVVKTTRAYLAIDPATGNVVSFSDNGQPETYLPAKPHVGQQCQQGEVVAMAEPVTVPAGRFANCLRIDAPATQPTDQRQSKFYARGIGLVADGKFKLVRHAAKKPPPKSIDPLDAEPIIPYKIAREALGYVGSDPYAEEVWLDAINDPALTANERSDLIEDLNEVGFKTFGKPTIDELPVVLDRLDVIERHAADAMDEVNAAAFAEAHKDLVNIANRLMRQMENP